MALNLPHGGGREALRSPNNPRPLFPSVYLLVKSEKVETECGGLSGECNLHLLDFFTLAMLAGPEPRLFPRPEAACSVFGVSEEVSTGFSAKATTSTISTDLW